MAWGNAPEKDFGKWREQAREKLLECIQPAPPVAPYDMKVIATEKRKGYEAQKLFSMFQNILVCRLICWFRKVKDHFLLFCFCMIMEHILLLEKKNGTSIWSLRNCDEGC